MWVAQASKREGKAEPGRSRPVHLTSLLGQAIQPSVRVQSGHPG